MTAFAKALRGAHANMVRDFILLLTLMITPWTFGQLAFGQSSTPPPEIGIVASWINVDAETGFDSANLHRGFGPRLTINLKRAIGIDSEILRYVGDVARWRASWNLKLTLRKEESAGRMNVFGITGFGLMKNNRFGFRGIATEATSPMFNLGGGIEFVPHQRVALRFSLVDSMFNLPRVSYLTDETRQKAEINLGVMLRIARR